MEHAEYFLATLARGLKVTLEGISLLCILVGLLKTAQLALVQPRRSRLSVVPLINIRICFGRWLSLALEFQLAADVVNTTVAPSLQALAQLGAIAIIRTFLNYFLSRELTNELAQIQKDAQETVPSEE
jgi:uncharacterized membrane protein